ncbi:MAG: diaminopimelate epimerase [Pseudomonadota bacterium]
MSDLAGAPYKKMNGLGNTFAVFDLRTRDGVMDAENACRIADPKTGPGCDQVITIEEQNGETYMGVWNADGSEVGACGNAARCVAHLLMTESGADDIAFATASEKLNAWRASDDKIAVDMGEPKFGWKDIPLAEQMDDTRYIDVKLGPIDNPVLWGPSAVNVGNPHCVFFVDDAEAQAIDRFGPLVENHPLFPERVNVSVAQALSRTAIRLRVWERGAGITNACGTAACAALVCAHRRRLTDRKATITLDGGDLEIEWRDDDRIVMTGPYADDGDYVLPADF